MKFFTFISIFLPFAVFHAAEYQPPQPYGTERYEAVWQKNPFTLKTAPAAIVKESFAKDLAISSIFTVPDETDSNVVNTTVNVVNTKTREQMRFMNQIESKGMKIKSVNVRDTRADTSVELESGGETAVLKYDESYIKSSGQQKAGGGNMKLPPGAGGVPGASGMPPVPVTQPPGAMPINGNRANIPMPNPGGVAKPFTAPNVPSPPMRRQLTAPNPRIPSHS